MLHRDLMLQAELIVAELMKRLDSNASEATAIETYQELSKVKDIIHEVTHSAVDYQEVVENLDDNILIADKNETILYVNPSYINHTHISPDVILGRRVSDVLQEGKYFTTATVPEVIKTKNRVMKLSSMAKTNGSLGFVTGVPVFDREGEIKYVIACNRGVSTFSELHENFKQFVAALSNLQVDQEHVQIYNDSQSVPESQMIGKSAEMKKIWSFINNVSTTDATVLITGESGVGKELIAEAIYKKSNRSEMPIIKVNCSSIPANLLESELFGYEKGAFSGANSAGKKGLLEAADKGTLLLDEIGDMPIDLQAKLLRVIQSNEITRVGGIKPIKLDIRLIASTNCNLKQKIKDGTFRSDLYYRLHVIPINVPPLRERTEDIRDICEYYKNYFCSKYNRQITLTEENYKLLCNYSWPGNIRELRNIMEYLVVCCSDHEYIDSSVLYATFGLEESSSAYVNFNADLTLNEAVAAYEKEFIKKAIESAHNLKEAGQILNIDISTVSRKLKQHGLTLK